MFYNFIPKYTDSICWKVRDAFSLQTFHTIFQQKYEHISDITFDMLTKH